MANPNICCYVSCILKYFAFLEVGSPVLIETMAEFVDQTATLR